MATLGKKRRKRELTTESVSFLFSFPLSRSPSRGDAISNTTTTRKKESTTQIQTRPWTVCEGKVADDSHEFVSSLVCPLVILYERALISLPLVKIHWMSADLVDLILSRESKVVSLSPSLKKRLRRKKRSTHLFENTFPFLVLLWRVGWYKLLRVVLAVYTRRER